METKGKKPFAIVWTHLPVVTLICPCIGHVGINGSVGDTHDFGASHYISLSHLTFGEPLQYVPLQIEPSESPAFDAAIRSADAEFTSRDHECMTNNCHHHVALALTKANYQHREWTATKVWCLVLRRGRFVTCCARVKTYVLWCCILLALGLLGLLAL